MAHQPPGDPRAQQRPIGSRRRDIARPEAFGSTPPPTKGRGGIARRLINFVLFVAALVLLGGIVWFVLSNTGVAGSDSTVKDGTKVTVVIPKGSSSTDVAGILADKGVVESETVFRARLKLNGDGADFRAGTFTIQAGSSYDNIVRTLAKGPAAAPTFSVVIPEGQRLEQTAAAIDDMRDKRVAEGATALPVFTGAQYLQVVKATPVPVKYQAPKGTKTIEGFLFPATYELKESASAQDFVQKQLAAFDANFSQVNLVRAKAAQLTPYDVVIVASLIEREARLAPERPKVGAVIWNRLKAGEPLGIDASNQYSVYKAGSKEFWVAELKQSDLDKDSPYNLRKVQGLPPTPIANPGLASLQAAANPAKVDFRYYVANPNGNGAHFFTSSYDEFLAHPFQNGG